MNFKEYIQHEMTLSAGEMEFHKPDFSKAQHIGDIAGYRIFRMNNYYGLEADGEIRCFMFTKVLDNNMEEIINLNTDKDYQNKNLAKNLIFFLKSWLQKSFLFGNVMTRAGQDFVKSLDKTKRFPMYWLNVKTGEKHPYNSQEDRFDLHPYRGLDNMTDWQILIEAAKKSFDIPMFEADYIKRFGSLGKITFFE